MIEKLIRPHLIGLQPYSSARDDFKGKADVFLDANENPFGQLNRYPDSKQIQLKTKLAAVKNVAPNQVFIGNGSDEIIDLLMRLTCEPGKAELLIFPPTYGMYKVSATINNLKIHEVELTQNFQLNQQKIEETLSKNPNIKLCFVCSPNNPTGNLINEIDWLCKTFNGLVIVDEAYINFSESNSMIEKINAIENLLVSQTFSKALGLAGARVGVAYANAELINWLTAIKPPYNVSQLNQQAALNSLTNLEKIEEQIKLIKQEREQLKSQLATLPFVKKIYKSEANFLLLKVDDSTLRYNQLKEQKIVVRNRHKLVENTIRITIGTPKENETLLQTMKQLKS